VAGRGGAFGKLVRPAAPELSILARKNRKSLNAFICDKLQMAI
jgi:hypothetical protein